MTAAAAFSIVVSGGDARDERARTLASLAAQDLPGVEVIVEDGGSPAAVNRAFARGCGAVMGLLRAGDVLLPGALRAASLAFATNGPPVVITRCEFLTTESELSGVEWPCEYRGHSEFLAIWKHGLVAFPQAALLWKRVAWQRCGPFDEGLREGYAYDLACRFSGEYGIAVLDLPGAAMRFDLHRGALTEPELLEVYINISRRHWGTLLSPRPWRLGASYWSYRHQWHERARHHARRAEEARESGRLASAAIELAATLAHSPKLARDRLLWRWWRRPPPRWFEPPGR